MIKIIIIIITIDIKKSHMSLWLNEFKKSLHAHYFHLFTIYS